MKAIQFGAGNIGRGFIGLLLNQNNYELVFADVIDDVINKLNKEKSYTVHILDDVKEDITVSNVRAVNSLSENIISEICTADIITTAVGVGILSKIAGTIANGIIKKMQNNNTKFLNIIACENAVMATSKLKKSVYENLDDFQKEFTDKYVGFADCSVDRIVPPVVQYNNMDVAVERYFEWNICTSNIKGDIKIKGANFADSLEAYIERKLFTLNTGHAICSYLGFLHHKDTILESISDDKIYNIVKGAMKESGQALVKKHNLDLDSHYAYIDKIIKRFKNPFLRDEVIRVGREPLRKLSASDRLVKPLLLAHKYGINTSNLIIGIAAALHYNNPEDKESVKLQEMLAKYGIESTIFQVSNISDEDLITNIKNEYFDLLEK